MLSSLQDFLVLIEAARTLKTVIPELHKLQCVGFPWSFSGCSPCCLSLGTFYHLHWAHSEPWRICWNWMFPWKICFSICKSNYYLTHWRKKSKCSWGWETSLAVKMLLSSSSLFLLLRTHPFFPGFILFCSSLHPLEHLLQKMNLDLTTPTWENRS